MPSHAICGRAGRLLFPGPAPMVHWTPSWPSPPLGSSKPNIHSVAPIKLKQATAATDSIAGVREARRHGMCLWHPARHWPARWPFLYFTSMCLCSLLRFGLPQPLPASSSQQSPLPRPAGRHDDAACPSLQRTISSIVGGHECVVHVMPLRPESPTWPSSLCCTLATIQHSPARGTSTRDRQALIPVGARAAEYHRSGFFYFLHALTGIVSPSPNVYKALPVLNCLSVLH